MTIAEREAELIQKFLVIPDIQDRFSCVLAHHPALDPIDNADRVDANLVQGCQSRVWLVCTHSDGVCRWRMDADSVLVRGLVGLLCEVFNGSTPDEASTFEPTIIEALGIQAQLSPTRTNGLRHVVARLSRS